MKPFVLTATALCAGLLLGYYLFSSNATEPVHAQSLETFYLDPSWGSLKGTLGSRTLVLEDENGVIRIVDLVNYHVSTKRLVVERLIERK